jgi:hypothetical protein
MLVKSPPSTFGVADAKRLLVSWSAYQNKLYEEQGPKHHKFLVRFLKGLQPFEFDRCDIPTQQSPPEVRLRHPYFSKVFLFGLVPYCFSQ